MRKISPPLLLSLLLSVLGGCRETASNHGVGSPAPLFAAEMLSGAPFFLAKDGAGKRVVLTFWATWCGACRAQAPEIETLSRRLSGKGDIVLAVNAGQSRNEVASYVAQGRSASLVALDAQGVIGRLYEVKGLPTTVVIDRNGKMIRRFEGVTAASRMDVEQ